MIASTAQPGGAAMVSVELVHDVVATLEALDVEKAEAAATEELRAKILDSARDPAERPLSIKAPAFSTSIHEAAHGLAMVKLGLGCDGLRHKLEGGGETAYLTSRSDFDPSIDIVVSLVGPIAESCYSGVPIEFLARNGGRADFLSARKSADKLGDDLHSILRFYAAMAVLLVDARWQEIFTVAQELFARFSLTGDELKEILRVH